MNTVCVDTKHLTALESNFIFIFDELLIERLATTSLYVLKQTT